MLYAITHRPTIRLQAVAKKLAAECLTLGNELLGIFEVTRDKEDTRRAEAYFRWACAGAPCSAAAVGGGLTRRACARRIPLDPELQEESESAAQRAIEARPPCIFHWRFSIQNKQGGMKKRLHRPWASAAARASALSDCDARVAAAGPAQPAAAGRRRCAPAQCDGRRAAGQVSTAALTACVARRAMPLEPSAPRFRVLE